MTIKVGRSRGVLFGGRAGGGASAGFAYAYSNISPSYSYTYIGSHLCFRMSERQRYKGATTLPLGRRFQVTRKVLVGMPVVWATERSE